MVTATKSTVLILTGRMQRSSRMVARRSPFGCKNRQNTIVGASTHICTTRICSAKLSISRAPTALPARYVASVISKSQLAVAASSRRLSLIGNHLPRVRKSRQQMIPHLHSFGNANTLRVDLTYYSVIKQSLSTNQAFLNRMFFHISHFRAILKSAEARGDSPRIPLRTTKRTEEPHDTVRKNTTTQNRFSRAARRIPHGSSRGK